jgi:hypothetical protein
MAKDKLSMAIDSLKMAYVVTNAAAFTSGEGQVVISDIILGQQEFQNPFIGVQTGVKYIEKVIDLGVGLTYIRKTNDSIGSLAVSGGSSLTDVSIQTVEMCVKEGYNPSQLNSKLAGKLLAAGSDPSTPVPLSDLVQTLKGKEIGKLNSYQLWQGNATGSTANRNFFDGWLKKISNGSATVVSGGSAAALASTTCLATMAAFNKVVITAFPEWITAGYAVFMSPAQFDTFYQTKFGTNGVIDSLTLNTGKPVLEFTFGSVTYYSMQGMTGSNVIVATRLGNLIAGTDLVSESDNVKFEYLPEGEIFRLEAVYKLGAQIARLAEVVATR